MEKSIKFKSAVQQDVIKIYNLVQKTIKEIYPKYYLKEIVDMFSEYHNIDNISKDIEAGNTYILLENNELVGTGTKTENHITRVYVLPKFQKKGYETYIMQQLEALIKEQYDFAYIDASLPACHLYTHLGYHTIDHGIWNCKNDVIQVYEIMRKQLTASQLILRPYKPSDAEIIAGWIKDEKAFRKWSSDRYNAYPITAADINYKYQECNGDCDEPDNFYPMTATDSNGPIGHLIFRYTNSSKTTIRLGFIIVDDSKRGLGYGKQMVQMAIHYAFDMLKASKITLGVFDNNPAAYYCYKAAGFQEIPMEDDLVFEILGEKWKCIEMEINRLTKLEK